MIHLLASAPLRLREISPVDFVPMAALLLLLVGRELIRARPGPQRAVTQHVMDLAVFPFVVVFLLFAGLRAYTLLG